MVYRNRTGSTTLVFICAVVLSCLTVRAQEPPATEATIETDRIILEQMQLGREAMDRGDFRQAREHFHLVLELDWNNPLAYQWWSAAEENLERHIRGLIRAGDRNASRGAYAEALLNYYEAQRLDSARSDVRSRLRWVGKKIYADRYVLAGLKYYLDGDIDRVHAALDSALHYDPENANALALREKVNFVAAAPTGQFRLRDDTAVWEIHLAALKKYRDGEYESAIKQWEKILEKYPGNGDVLANIEQARLRLRPESDTPGNMAKDK